MFFLNICNASEANKLLYYYQEAYKELWEQTGVQTVLIYKNESENIGKCYQKEESPAILYMPYHHITDIYTQISTIWVHKDNSAVNTFSETLVPLSWEIKTWLGQEIPRDTEIFRSKKLQREYLHKYYPDSTTSFLTYKVPADLDPEEIGAQIGYPCVIKPSGGVQSASVHIVNTTQELITIKNSLIQSLSNTRKRGYESSHIIVEEFLDGEMFSIDYYIDEDQNIQITVPVRVLLGEDIRINDSLNFARIASENERKKVPEDKLTKLVTGTVKALDLKNTFIHHEFKQNSQGELRTIEVNGRIGGYRLEMYKKVYGINILSMPFNYNVAPHIPEQTNMAVILVYATYESTLEGFREDLIENIKALPSFLHINPMNKLVWQKIGLTKEGYPKAMVIKLTHKNADTLSQDIGYIQKHYTDILKLSG